MVATRSARERKAAAQAGPLATVLVEAVEGRDEFVYRILCTTCTSPTARGSRRWSTYRPGDGNAFLAATDRWVFHLHEQHPDVGVADAPCLAYLPEAQQRLHERREGS